MTLVQCYGSGRVELALSFFLDYSKNHRSVVVSIGVHIRSISAVLSNLASQHFENMQLFQCYRFSINVSLVDEHRLPLGGLND